MKPSLFLYGRDEPLGNKLGRKGEGVSTVRKGEEAKGEEGKWKVEKGVC